MFDSIQHILLIDDNAATNFFNTRVLKREGFSGAFTITENGQEALGLLLNNIVPDMVLLDLNMPIMGGVEFLKNAQENIHFKNSYCHVFIMLGSDIQFHEKEEIKSIRNVHFINAKMLDAQIIRYMNNLVQQETRILKDNTI